MEDIKLRTKSKHRSAECLARFIETTVKEEEFRDKQERLDAGKPTEIIEDRHELTLRIQELSGRLPIRMAKKVGGDIGTHREIVGELPGSSERPVIEQGRDSTGIEHD